MDQLIGILLLGLGVTTPFNPNVKGDETIATQEAQMDNDNDDEDEQENEQEQESEEGSLKPKRTIRALRKNALEIHEEFTERMEASREAAKQEFEARREAFKERLELIKDAKKKLIVEKLGDRCQEINTKRTDKMTEMLEKLSSILTNVSNRSAAAAAAGTDTSSVDTAVTAAQTAIADAQSAVANQAGITCEITITSEKNLKTDVGKTISGLQSDLKEIYGKVIAARKAVSGAVRALALVLGESLTPGTTP